MSNNGFNVSLRCYKKCFFVAALSIAQKIAFYAALRNFTGSRSLFPAITTVWSVHLSREAPYNCQAFRQKPGMAPLT